VRTTSPVFSRTFSARRWAKTSGTEALRMAVSSAEK
jgi:hypothetical protein